DLTATAMSGTSWSCPQPAGPCTRSDVLAPGASYPPITLTVNVANNAPALVTNTATVSGGGALNPAGGTAFVRGLNAANPHDFDGDGKSDILWRLTSGQVATWTMSSTTVIGGGSPGSATSDWSIVGQRDFNGDGLADILWRNTSGQVAVWLMNGSTAVGGG